MTDYSEYIISHIPYKAVVKQSPSLCFYPRWKMCRDLWLPLPDTAHERVSLLTASAIIFMDIIILIFWLIHFFISFGRFVISVGWDHRIDIYLVSIKWPACFPYDLFLYQHNSPDGSHKMVDCHDLFLPSGILAFIAVHSISIFHLLQCFSLLKSAWVLFGVVYSPFPSDSPLFHLLQELLFTLEMRILASWKKIP